MTEPRQARRFLRPGPTYIGVWLDFFKMNCSHFLCSPAGASVSPETLQAIHDVPYSQFHRRFEISFFVTPSQPDLPDEWR